MVKSLPPVQETRVRSLGQEDPLEKETATHSSILGQGSLTWSPGPLVLGFPPPVSFLTATPCIDNTLNTVLLQGLGIFPYWKVRGWKSWDTALGLYCGTFCPPLQPKSRIVPNCPLTLVTRGGEDGLLLLCGCFINYNLKSVLWGITRLLGSFEKKKKTLNCKVILEKYFIKRPTFKTPISGEKSFQRYSFLCKLLGKMVNIPHQRNVNQN